MTTSQSLDGFLSLEEKQFHGFVRNRHVPHFTMKSKFNDLATTGKKQKWLRNLFLDIKLWSESMLAISVECDIRTTMFNTYEMSIMENLDILACNRNMPDSR